MNTQLNVFIAQMKERFWLNTRYKAERITIISKRMSTGRQTISLARSLHTYRSSKKHINLP